MSTNPVLTTEHNIPPERFTQFYESVQVLLAEFEEDFPAAVKAALSELRFRATFLIHPGWLENIVTAFEKDPDTVDCLLNLDVQIRLRSVQFFGSQCYYHRIARDVLTSTMTLTTKQPTTQDREGAEDLGTSNQYNSTLIQDSDIGSFHHFLENNRYIVTLFILTQ